MRDFPKLAGRQGDPAASLPPLFAWLSTSRLLLVPETERTAGRPSPDPGEPQEHVGGGNAHHRWRRVCHHLPAVVQAQLKVHSDPGQICLEKLRNKHPAISYGCLFIKGVSFVFDPTSYITLDTLFNSGHMCLASKRVKDKALREILEFLSKQLLLLCLTIDNPESNPRNHDDVE